MKYSRHKDVLTEAIQTWPSLRPSLPELSGFIHPIIENVEVVATGQDQPAYTPSQEDFTVVAPATDKSASEAPEDGIITTPSDVEIRDGSNLSPEISEEREPPVPDDAKESVLNLPTYEEKLPKIDEQVKQTSPEKEYPSTGDNRAAKRKKIYALVGTVFTLLVIGLTGWFFGVKNDSTSRPDAVVKNLTYPNITPPKGTPSISNNTASDNTPGTSIAPTEKPGPLQATSPGSRVIVPVKKPVVPKFINTGDLILKISPPAQAYLDGGFQEPDNGLRQAGIQRFSNLEARTYRLTVWRDGYQRVRQNVTIQRGDTKELRISLEPD